MSRSTSTLTAVDSEAFNNLGVEIGSFAIVFAVVITMIMSKFNGELRGLYLYFATRNWPLLQDTKHFSLYVNLLMIITTILIFMPFATFLIWAGAVRGATQNSLNEADDAIPIFIILVGFALFALLLGAAYIYWGNFKVQSRSKFLIAMFLIGIYAFKIYALLDDEVISFNGLSAVFLTLNGFIVIILAYLSYGSKQGSLMVLMDKLPSGENRSKNLHDDAQTLDQKYEQEMQDPAYMPTEKEIFTLVTSLKNRDDLKETALVGGFQDFFMASVKCGKWMTQKALYAVLYAISLGVLVAYGILVDKYTKEKSLGWVTVVAVVTTDFITYFLSFTIQSYGPFVISIVILVFRILMFVFGGRYWFFGYCIIFIFLGLFQSYQIIEKRLPVHGFASDDGKGLTSFLQRPEFAAFISCLVFAILTLVLAIGGIDIPLEGPPVEGNPIGFWLFGVISFCFNIVIYCLMASYRLYQRRKGNIMDKYTFVLFHRSFNAYYLYHLIAYAGIILAGVFWSKATDEYFMLLLAIFLPPILEFSLTLYFNFVKNGYAYLGDVQKANEKLLRAKKQEEAKKNVKQMKNNQDVVVIDVSGNRREISPRPSEEAERPNEITPSKQPEEKNFIDKTGHAFGFVFQVGDIDEGGEDNILADWRAEKVGCFSAFWNKKLIRTDYKIIVSAIMIVGFLTAFSVINYYVSENQKLTASTISVSYAVFLLAILPLMQYFSTLQLSVNNVVSWTLALILNYGFGAYYFARSNNKLEEDVDRSSYALYFIFIYPFIYMFCSGLYKWRDDKWKLGKDTIVAALLSLLLWIGGCIFIWIVYSSAVGGCLLLVGFVFYSLLALLHIYKKNNDSLPRLVLLIYGVTFSVIIVGVFIAGLLIESFNDFLAFSIAYLTVVLLLLVKSLQEFISNFNDRMNSPTYYSHFIFPIFKIDPKTNALSRYDSIGVKLIGSLFLMLIFGVITVIWTRPIYIGVNIICLAEVIAFVIILLIITQNPTELGDVVYNERIKIDSILKKAWLDAKKTFFHGKSANSLNDYLNYTSLQENLTQLKSKIEAQKSVMPPNEKSIRDLVQSLLEEGKLSLSMRETAQDELSILVTFQLKVILEGYNFAKLMRVRFVQFVSKKKKELDAAGITFTGQEEGTIDSKYHHIMTDLEDMRPDLVAKFKQMMKDDEERMEKEAQDAANREKEEEEARRRRQEELNNKIKASQNANPGSATPKTASNQPSLLPGNVTLPASPSPNGVVTPAQPNDANIPISQMVDGPRKFQRIVEEFKKSGKKYEDKDFLPNAKSLGSKVAARNAVKDWKRPPEGAELFKDNYSPMDVQQGALGDCYFLSALSCLGEQNCKKMFLQDDTTLDHKAQCGAFILRFYSGAQPIYVIVDDYLPLSSSGEPAFCHCLDPKELWAPIAEKAYAKLYGSYEIIEGGKVSFALSDMTNGKPEEIILKNFQSNPEGLWKTLVQNYSQKYLMGSGSPANEMGDRAISDQGIVQGHAYSVLRVEELDDNKIIKLRNPHGARGMEWTGDWSDHWVDWNDRWKKILNEEFEEDGAFWMCLEDFVYEYRALYVCRIFDPKIWSTIGPIPGKWEGKTAAGLPTKDNPKAVVANNPQYGIRAEKRTTVFIELRQNEMVDSFKGKLPIMFIVQKNNGKIISSLGNDKQVGSSGPPTPLAAVTAEIDLVADTYPTVFSLVAATFYEGEKGKGSFSLMINSTNPVTLVDLKP